jgi:gliding motility-associated-like protein
MATKIVHVKVDPAPQIITASQVFVQSSSEVFMLDASSSTGNSLKFKWSSTQGGVIVSGGETTNPQVKGIGKYYLQVTDRYGCSDLDSIVVGLYVQVKAVNDTAEILVNNAVDINVLANDIPKKKLDPSTLRIVTSPQNGIATVVGDSLVSYLPNEYFVGSDNFVYSICDYFQNCDQATVLVLVNDMPFFIPEAFSPNGDGINDEFEIKGLTKYKTVEIEIFNRWGNVVYQSQNYGKGQGKDGFWDGTASQGVRTGSGQVSSGTYFYVLKLDGKEKINGTIYLDR